MRPILTHAASPLVQYEPVMLGDILHGLTGPAAAAVALGASVAGKIRHLRDLDGDDVLLYLLGAMAAEQQPGAVAVDRIRPLALPDPIRARVTRNGR